MVVKSDALRVSSDGRPLSRAARLALAAPGQNHNRPVQAAPAGQAGDPNGTIVHSHPQIFAFPR